MTYNLIKPNVMKITQIFKVGLLAISLSLLSCNQKKQNDTAAEATAEEVTTPEEPQQKEKVRPCTWVGELHNNQALRQRNNQESTARAPLPEPTASKACGVVSHGRNPQPQRDSMRLVGCSFEKVEASAWKVWEPTE